MCKLGESHAQEGKTWCWRALLPPCIYLQVLEELIGVSATHFSKVGEVRR